MSQPLIGLTTYNGKNNNNHPIVALGLAYVDAILAAGGVPVLIPSSTSDGTFQVLFDRLDGILLTGGGDINTVRYAGVSHPRIGDVDTARDSIELSLLDAAVKNAKPFLGICRGLQLVNVGLGGTLFTHIPDQLPGAIPHDFYDGFPRDHLAHDVTIEAGTRLAGIVGETTIPVNSLHHQGAKDIPDNLIPTAFSPDGLVEALELPDHPFGLAVQWHPECLPEQPSSGKLFRAFVAAADQNRKNK
jgi:putative glutamine amidotransferase